jgi:hypothetical protein
MEFVYVRLGFDQIDLRSGPVDEIVFFMNCDDLSGVYLDYALIDPALTNLNQAA